VILTLTLLNFAYLMPDYWLEVSLHPEGPATGQLDKVFPVVFLDPKSNSELVHKVHITLLASHASLPMVTSTLRPNIAL
jgi:hypothetical protein